MRRLLGLVCVLGLVVTRPLAASPLKLPALFGDHMVVQQGLPVVVWGWDEPGHEVVADLAGERARTLADARGQFRIELSPLAAGGPHELMVTGSSSVTFRDVLVGEVWVGSGQSNMDYAFSRSHSAAEESPKADLPAVRLFKLEKREAARPAAEAAGTWVVCTPESVMSFSAVAYYFGSALHRELDVPVGLILSSWSGTSAESWTPRHALEAHPELSSLVDAWEAQPLAEQMLFDASYPFSLEFRDIRLIPKQAGTPPGEGVTEGAVGSESDSLLGGDWRPSGPEAVVTPEPSGAEGLPDTIRFSGHVLPGQWSWAERALGRDGGTADLSRYEAIAFQARGPVRFTLSLEQPTVVDWDRYSSESFELTGDWRAIRIPLDDLEQAGWGVARLFTPHAIEKLMLRVDLPRSLPGLPGGLFNAMIAPLTRYGIRGVIWYQGEGNAGRAQQYRPLLTALIEGWREAWGVGDFPFGIVQLPNFKPVQEEPSDGDWPRLREAQRLTAATLPATGLAVTIDLGLAEDVHPPYKKEVGRRLARWALASTYGREGVPSGPLFRGMTREGDAIRARFDHVGDGLIAKGGGALRGFAIAAADRRFRWAQARVEGDSVVVWNEDVPDPVAVRYAWADNPICNLYNEEGLPASPFRTDAW